MITWFLNLPARAAEEIARFSRLVLALLFRKSTFQTKIKPSYYAPTHAMHDYLEKLVSLDKEAAIERHKNKQAVVEKTPLFSLAEVVFLKPVPQMAGDGRYPAIGEKTQSDCKIMELVQLTKGGDFFYVIVAGSGSPVYKYIHESLLVKYQDKCKYEATATLELIEDTELAPVGTKFYLIGGYYSNEPLGIWLDREFVENKLKSLFKPAE